MRISLRWVDNGPALCIASKDIWYKAEDVALFVGLQDNSTFHFKKNSDKQTCTNFLMIDGLDEYLRLISDTLEQARELPKSLVVDQQADYLPPILEPPLIFGLAGNCPMTWRRKGISIPNYPVGYVRPASSLTGHQKKVVLEPSVTSFRCAVELGIVIGKKARNVSREEAMDHVFGYTIVNDMISNHWKDFAAKHNPNGEPTFHELLITSYYGRGSDGFCPMGPMIVSKDEIDNPYDLLMFTRVNGELADRSHTSAMVVGIENCIEYLSSLFTLHPGSVIHMGTMGIDGVAIAVDQPMNDNTVVELEIESIGVLCTRFDDRRKI